MKKIKIITPLFLLFLLPSVLMAQKATKKTEVVYIQTSAICGECKVRIETAVNGLKGVKKSELNLADSKLMVEYSPTKVTVEKIKGTVVATGYDADDMTADAAAYQALPMCCKKDTKKH